MPAKLTFLGAARSVTGSQYLLEINNTRIMVDCGMYQERDLQPRNWEPFQVKPSEIDYLLVTHAHLDHTGLIPKLVKDGFNGKIYTTAATADITDIILQDSAHIQEEDANFKRKRHEREGRKGPHPEMPLYNTEDALACQPLFEPVNYEETVSLGDGIKVSFHDAGHVLGSAMIKIIFDNDGEQRTIIFSGDVGQRNKPILRDRTVFTEADYVVVESTYGDRVHEKSEDISEALAGIINRTRQAGGNIVVPSFALERAQELLYYLNELLIEDKIPHLVVFLDSPMAVKVTEVFKQHPELYDKEMAALMKERKSPFHFSGLKLVQSVDESKGINHISGTTMIIAGSGMCNGGRIKHHLVSNISRPESTILFVGFQARGTLGRVITGGAETVRILGQTYPVRANIAQIHGFSAHADSNGLLRWLGGLQKAPRQVFVTHGEDEVAISFAGLIKEKLGWETMAPEYRQSVTLS